MLTDTAQKIQFMECRIAGERSKFVLHLPGGQCLYQVLEFEDMEQYRTFAAANDRTGVPYTQVGTRMIALRFSGNMQHIDITQANAEEIGRQVIDIEKQAAKWYDEYLTELKIEN